MCSPHVIIDTRPTRERLHAHPTYMCLAHCACHMIAPLDSLDKNLAARTGFNVMISHPFLEEVVSAIFISTFESVVSFNMTIRANTQQTRRALENCVRRSRAIHLSTVRSRTVVKFIWMSVNVGREGGLH